MSVTHTGLSKVGRPKLAKIYGPEALRNGHYVVHMWPRDERQKFDDYAKAFDNWKKYARILERTPRNVVRVALFYVSYTGTIQRLFASDGYPFETLHV